MRKEKDTLGEKEIPDDAYFGVQTMRALENFPVSGLTERKELIYSYVELKKACAIVNMDLEVLDEEIGDTLIKACDDILNGGYEDQFPVDVFQAGAGTSFNMNVNEVIANKALEMMGKKKGEYEYIHPNDHVNMSQSSNDTFPTASHIAIIRSTDELIQVLNKLTNVFKKKGKEFLEIFKSGRTHLMDATPVTLGDEFLSYASSIKRASRRILEARDKLLELPIGGTAVGTGVNTPDRYRENVVNKLSDITGFELIEAKNSFELINSRSQMVEFSNTLKGLALELNRIANDLRLLGSGPSTGLAEIKLPRVQPGSSIMPGKINPVMAECLNMVCFHIIGNDTTVSMAGEAGQLEMNVMAPIMTHNILNSISLFVNYLPVFQEKCLEGIEADEKRCNNYLKSSPALATLLAPKIGYEQAAQLAQEALKKDKHISKLAVDKGLLTEKEAKEIFDSKEISRNKYRKDIG
ncbi:MAG: aspartate ammonia-lyase [Thermoplasmatota archaeon]